MSDSSDKIFEYCLGIAREFHGRLSRINVFVKHNLSSGNANEVILREFLASHTPGDYAVEQGFICDPFVNDRVSKQCDILIYNQNRYPLVYSEGSIKIVSPYAAKMVIEVKTNADKKDIFGALENIASVKKIEKNILGVIFSFQSPSTRTTLKNLKEYNCKFPSDLLPDAIFFLDKGLIIHRWGWLRGTDMQNHPNADEDAYSVRHTITEESGAVIGTLLLMFFELVSRGSMGNASYMNAGVSLNNKYTTRLADIIIGSENKSAKTQ